MYFGLLPALLLRPLSRKLHAKLTQLTVGTREAKRDALKQLPVRTAHSSLFPACWCQLCLLLPERVNGARVRITGQVRERSEHDASIGARGVPERPLTRAARASCPRPTSACS
jgi:hypothetical protein